MNVQAAMIAAIRNLKATRSSIWAKRSRKRPVISLQVGLLCGALDILIVILSIPFAIAESQSKSFEKLAQFSPERGFMDSYTTHIRYYRASVGTAILAGITLAIQIISVAGLSLFTLFGNPQPTKAVGENMIGFWSGGAAPSGWTCISCTAGDDFYQLFPRGAATYGGTGGATTHTHSITGSVASNTSAVGGDAQAGVNEARNNHAHSGLTSSSMGTGTLLPEYRELKLIRYDTEGTPATLPSGFIGIFDTSVPAGWTRYSNQDAKMIYGANGSTTTGGAATHTHGSVTYTTATTPSALSKLASGASTTARTGHSHTEASAGTTAAGDHTPPYIEVILASADSTTSIPTGLITLWDATPDASWNVISDASEAFNSKFLRGAATYGGTGGASTHTHSNLVLASAEADLTDGIGDNPAAFNYTNGTHTHNVTLTFGSTNSLPPYRDAIVAQYSPGVTISGNTYTNEGTTALDGSSVNKTVMLRVNGAGSYTDEITTSDGAWSIGSVTVNSGDIVTVYLDGETEQATTIYVSDGTAQSNVNLYQNRVIVRADTGSITNGNLATGDNGDADVLYSVASSNLTVDSDNELHVWTGDTYDPGGTVTTQGSGDLHVDDSATAYLDTATNTIADDVSVDGSATLNIDANSTVNGDIATTGTGVIASTAGTPTTTLGATGAVGGGSGAITFYALTQNSGTTTVNSDTSVTNTLTVNTGNTVSIASSKTITSGTAGTVTINGTGTISGSGTLTVQNSNLGTGGTLSSLVRFDATSGDISMPTRTYGGTVEIYSNSAASARVVTPAAGTHTLQGNLTLNAANTQNVTLAGTTNDPVLNITGDFDFTGAGSGTEVITAPDVATTWTVSGNVTFTDGTYTKSAETLVMNGSGKTLTSASQTLQNLTLSGSITLANATHTVAGNLSLSGGTITAGTSTITMTGTSNTITGGGQTLNNLTIDPSSAGTITLNTSDLTVSGTLHVATGDILSLASARTLTHSGSTLTLSGTISGAGRLTYMSSTSFPTTGTISSILRFDATNNNQTMGVRDYFGDVEVMNTSNASARTVLVGNGVIGISGGLTMRADGTQNVTLDGDTNEAFLNVSGDVDFTGTGSGTEIITTGSQSWFWSGNVDLTGGTLTTGASHVIYFDGSGKTLTSGGNAFQNIAFVGSTTLGDALDVNGNLDISSGTLTASGNAMNVAGNWANDSTFTPGGNTVTFDAGALSKTIVTGGTGAGKTFANVVFNNASGGWTIQTNNMTVTDNLTFTAAASVLVQSGRTIEVQGNFSNSTPSVTTWTGTTLYLNGSGGLQTINTKGSGDAYGTLRIGASEDVAMWDSSASTVTMDGGACLLSQDNAGTDGRLHMYGSCNSRTNEYWTYATDFDGTTLVGGSERKADVRFDSGASLTVDAGDTLTMTGQGSAANRTSVGRISSGNFGLTVNGTINAQYYDVDYTDASGLNITSTATVTELSDGSFDNIASGASASYITVSGISSSKTFSNVVFDAAADGADTNAVYNVNADGSGINWIFTAAAGNKAGEASDREVNSAVISWTTHITAVNDGTVSDADFTNSASQLSANWTVATTTGIDHYEYAIGTSPSGTQVLGYTSTGLSTSVTKTGLTLTNGTEYFITVRAVDAAAEVIDEVPSDGMTVDTAAATFSNIVTSATLSSFTVTWTSSEGTTAQVQWGLTDGYGNTTTEQTDLVTSHSATVSGLAANTTYHFRLLGTDRAGNQTISSDQAVTTSAVDSTVITNTQATILSATSVRITWTTNHAADSKVRYGLTTAYGQEVYDATLVTSHSITLTGLEPGQTYHYEVLSVGNTSTNDADATFTTDTEDTDTEITLPNMIIINEEDAREDSNYNVVDMRKAGTLELSGEAEPNALLNLRIASSDEYTTTTTTDSAGTWSVSIPLKDTPLDLGSHEVFATVTKNGQTTAELKIAAFTLSTASYLPSPTILTPESGSASIESRPMITGLAQSGNTVHLYIDGVRIATVKATTHTSGTGSFGFMVTNDLSAGVHTLHAVAVTGASTSSNSPDTVFTVQLPFIGVTFRSADVIAASPEPYIAIEGIGAGGSRVDFYLNDEFLDRIGLLRTYTDVEHFTYRLYANNLVPKEYTLYAIAYDDAGKPSRKSNIISFTKTSDVAAPLLVTSLGSAPVPFQQQQQQPIQLPMEIGPGPDGTYTVKSGDSLWKIAEDQLGDGGRFAEIILLNKETHPELLTDPGTIYSGWILRLP